MKNTKRIRDMLAGAALTALALGLTIPALAATGSRSVKVWYDDIRLVVDGRTVTLRDEDGSAVEPFTLDGVAYLPVRALGVALGMDVKWDGAANTITLTSPARAGQDVGLEAAKTAALSHAGISAADAVFFKAERDWDDGRAIYEVEFYCGSTEYDYDIDAATGTILGWDHDAEGHTIPGGHSSHNTHDAYGHENHIGLDRARALAQDKAPGATLTSCKLDWEDGRAVYEGELRDGGMEYEFEIDAVTGAFLQWESEWDD